jgi:hypothetical protein
MKKYLFFGIFAVFVMNCSSDIKKQISPNRGNITTIKPNAHSNKISVFDVFEKIDIIPLETTDNSLLSHIPKIDIDDTLLFVQNKHDKLVYVYDTAGKLKYKIGTEGQGPGEIWNPDVFALNKVKKEVWITNNFHKIFQYDYQGNLKGEMPLNLFFHDMYISDNGFIYFYASKFTNHNKDGGYDCWELWIKNIKDIDSEQYKP